MKKVLASFIVMLMVVSIAPAVFAEKISVNSVGVTASLRSGSGDSGMCGADEGCAEGNGSEVHARIAVRHAQAEGNKVMNEVRNELKNKIKDMDPDYAKRLKAKLNSAIKRCAETDNPEKCRESLQKRISNAVKLTPAQVERLKKLESARIVKSEKFRNTLKKEAFAMFKLENHKARNVLESKLKEARDRYKNAIKAFNEKKEKARERKQLFLETKKELNKCKDVESEDCSELRKRVREHARSFFADNLDVAIAHLERVYSKVESSEALSEEEAAEILTELDSKIDAGKVLKEEVLSITNETSKEEIDALRDKIKDYIRSVVPVMRTYAGNVINARMGVIIVRSKALEEKLDRVVEKIIEEGKDPSTVEALIAQFDEKIESARTNYELAREKIISARTDEENRNLLMDEAHALMVQAHKDLKDAHNILKDIMKELRNLKHEDLLEDAGDEAVAETETESESE